MKLNLTVFALLLLPLFLFNSCNDSTKKSGMSIVELKKSFLNPPNSARPGVYWYFMDGNLSKEGMTADLESMKKVGIGYVLFLEVNVGVPRGKVDFLSEEWQALFTHAVKECERLGIAMTLGTGPGWTGSGGPWVSPDQSMQHLVSSTIFVSGSEKGKIKLSVPEPKKPYFGEKGFTPELREEWINFYEDVAVLAFPTSTVNKQIDDIDEKALYYRAPYTSAPGVKQYLPSLSAYEVLPKEAVIEKNQIIDLTDKLLADGTLDWEVPSGNWTVMRFGRRNNGAVTRPAPLPGLGFECDKFDTLALKAHLDNYTEKLLSKIGARDTTNPGGLKMLHIDSWEMGSQNWTSQFRDEFIKRRGYDPLPFYPVYAGNIVESLEISERFLWDLRLTSQELVLEYHAGQVKKYSHRNGLGLSIEPYDMNPAADLELGAVADVPMCEFWSKGYGFNSSFSCIEATSIAHVNGIPLVPAESFTAGGDEGWKQYPGSMKDQGDWAFAAGINRFVYHTFQHQALDDNLKPGMTMGPYGVHWNRSQTWWPMAEAYHRYVSRCQFILQQGRTVADILYLTPEGAPHVFRAPSSALTEDEVLPDRKGYNFDGCSPGQLYNAFVKDNQIVFPGGATYRILILPFSETMTPELIEKIRSLVANGAIIIGVPPFKSPGLSGFPECDKKVKSIAAELWGSLETPSGESEKIFGKGKIIWGDDFYNKNELYPSYDIAAKILNEMDLTEDFKSDIPVRYTHRTTPDWDVYFVSNRTNESIKGDCTFRAGNESPELWDPLTGETRTLAQFVNNNACTTISLQFDAHQSYFIVFAKSTSENLSEKSNFPEVSEIATLNGSWDVSFDPKLGGPENIHFDSLADWTLRSEEGIKYYSGIAVYKQKFDLQESIDTDNYKRIYLNLGEVCNLARIRLNGHDMGVIWTNPWKVDISEVVKEKDNFLEIEVANLWPNRLIGDEKLPDDGIKDRQWPEWLINEKERTSGRFTFTTSRHYTSNSPLLKSGLIGPVTIQQESFILTK